MMGGAFCCRPWHRAIPEAQAKGGVSESQPIARLMHELSIAMSIVEFAEAEAEKRGSPRVAAVHLRLGAFSGVVKDALLTSFEMACTDTRLQGSRLVVEEVPLLVYCSRCDARRSVNPNGWFICTECGEPTPQIVQGKELEVTALELDE
jgi:hydrogenase nickel incorporation protein HypA/HybF